MILGIYLWCKSKHRWCQSRQTISFAGSHLCTIHYLKLLFECFLWTMLYWFVKGIKRDVPASREGSPPREAKAAVPAHLERSKVGNLSVREWAHKPWSQRLGSKRCKWWHNPFSGKIMWMEIKHTDSSSLLNASDQTRAHPIQSLWRWGCPLYIPSQWNDYSL